jgi:phage host-nuclease inhibitor protein Gam
MTTLAEKTRECNRLKTELAAHKVAIERYRLQVQEMVGEIARLKEVPQYHPEDFDSVKGLFGDVFK